MMNKKLSIILAIVLAITLTSLGGIWIWEKNELKKIAEKEKQTEEENAKKNEEIKNENVIQSEDSEEAIRNEKLLVDLAKMNKEPIGSTHTDIEQATEQHIRGRVTFDLEPKKNSIFFASNVGYAHNNSNSLPSKDKQEWSVVYSEIDASLDCSLARAYSFPESMTQDCVKVEKNSQVDSIIVPEYWKLASGDPKVNCSIVQYKGEVEVRGWYEWRQSYSEKEWVVHIDDRDLSKMIIVFPEYPYFMTTNKISGSLRERLKNATKEQPATFTVKGIGYYCEGLPWLNF